MLIPFFFLFFFFIFFSFIFFSFIFSFFLIVFIYYLLISFFANNFWVFRLFYLFYLTNLHIAFKIRFWFNKLRFCLSWILTFFSQIYTLSSTIILRSLLLNTFALTFNLAVLPFIFFTAVQLLFLAVIRIVFFCLIAFTNHFIFIWSCCDNSRNFLLALIFYGSISSCVLLAFEFTFCLWKFILFLFLFSTSLFAFGLLILLSIELN